MRLSTRLTIAMVALGCLATTAVGVLTYRNIAAFALPRALDRIGYPRPTAGHRACGLGARAPCRCDRLSLRGGRIDS